ncbi:hypothetical protein [Tropicibacter oceani]|uniref:Uncharacterized protein n=1 Tax=Tropicibacter oceani TaxID=3058420 RepID=A0ABY8QCX1_9RHOB|nr:hypothetical protein [Tropicibacter oceani]WGW02467.1 hypothetical protein QF118_10965 [Tropicibacter oceani]
MYSWAVEVFFFAGFLLFWLGGVLLMVPFVWRIVFGPGWTRRMSGSAGARMDALSPVVHAEMQRAGRDRRGRLAQALIALGTVLLMLSGLAWLVSAIAAQ